MNMKRLMIVGILTGALLVGVIAKVRGWFKKPVMLSIDFDRLKHAQKIAVIGCAGSGKSWLALRLHQKLQLPLYHLDEYYWLPGWNRISEEEFTKIHHELCMKKQWIMEGIYSRYMRERFEYADTIIFLDIPRYQCLWNVIVRAIKFHSKLIPGVPAGCQQNMFSWKFLEFLQWIWNFPYRSRPKIVALLDEYADTKQVIILKSREEVNELVNRLG